MTKLVILEYPDPRLRRKAVRSPAVDDAVRLLVDEMLETMYASNGVGLAATQVDVQQRLLVLDVSETRNQPLVLVNPEIIERRRAAPTEEGCLSVPGIYDKVQRATQHPRPRRSTARAAVRDGGRGLLAVCVQHELDHLEGRCSSITSRNSSAS